MAVHCFAGEAAAAGSGFKRRYGLNLHDDAKQVPGTARARFVEVHSPSLDGEWEDNDGTVVYDSDTAARTVNVPNGRVCPEGHHQGPPHTRTRWCGGRGKP